MNVDARFGLGGMSLSVRIPQVPFTVVNHFSRMVEEDFEKLRVDTCGDYVLARSDFRADNHSPHYTARFELEVRMPEDGDPSPTQIIRQFGLRFQMLLRKACEASGSRVVLFSTPRSMPEFQNIPPPKDVQLYEYAPQPNWWQCLTEIEQRVIEAARVPEEALFGAEPREKPRMTNVTVDNNPSLAPPASDFPLFHLMFEMAPNVARRKDHPEYEVLKEMATVELNRREAEKVKAFSREYFDKVMCECSAKSCGPPHHPWCPAA